MKILRHIETCFFCVVFLLGMSIVIVTMGAERLEKIYGLNSGIIDYFTKNVTIQTHIVDDRWREEYPFQESLTDRYVEKISEVKKVVESFCTVSFPYNIYINNIVSKYKKDIISYDIDMISSTYEADKYVREPCLNVVEFANALVNEGYQFLYVQTPSKDTIVYCQEYESDIADLTILERSRRFMNALEEAQVNVMDIAREPKLSLQYDSTNHWSPADGLLCASLIARELNENYEFNFNIGDYDISAYRDLMSIYAEMENAIEKNCGYVFEVPVPIKETAYTLTYAEDMLWEGNFQETLIQSAEEWNLSGGAYHNVFRMNNSLIYEIHNKNSETNKGKKILVIGDSFNWPVSSYLSIGIEDIVVIHNASFSGSLMTYIRQMQPDAVLIVYNDAEFNEIYTNDAFNLE